MIDSAIDVQPMKPISSDLHHSIEQFLFREARLLDTDQQRTWLQTMVHPNIRYKVFSRQLRNRKDQNAPGPDRVHIFDDDLGMLDKRVRQFETGMQWRSDPPERLRHLISNVEGYMGEEQNQYRIFSNCLVFRNRRVHEESHFIYGRYDVLESDANGSMRLLSREIDYDQRFVEGRNLLFFL